MASNPELIAEARRMLNFDSVAFSEKKMFGGVAFMVGGNLACGVQGDELMVRVGPDAYDAALGEPFIGPMKFTGSPMKGWVTVAESGCRDLLVLQKWVRIGVAFAQSLPAK